MAASDVERLRDALLQSGTWRYGQVMVAGVFYDGPSELLDALLAAVRADERERIAKAIEEERDGFIPSWSHEAVQALNAARRIARAGGDAA